MRFIVLLLFPLIVAASVPVIDGVELGKEEKIKDVKILSAEKDGARFYLASFHKDIEGNFDKALEFVLNFPKRCNNSYRKERKLTDKKVDCVYHNENLIESEIVKNLKSTVEAPDLIERFVLKRRIWNKGLHTYNDLVTVKKVKPAEGQKRVVEVSYRMLKDDEAKQLIDNPVPFDNAFYYTLGTYRMAETNDGKISIDYSYLTKTDHWFLTSSMIQGSIYASLASGARHAVDGIQGAISSGN